MATKPPKPKSLETRVRRLVARGINDALDEVFRQSQLEVPIDAEAADSGALMDSGHVSKKATVRDLEGEVSYGTAYGAAQHEGWAYHTINGVRRLWVVRKHTMPGRKTHYLSDPLKAIAPRLEVSIERIVALGLKERQQ